MTGKEHKAQHDLVTRSVLLADTTSERRGVYAKRKAVPAPVVLNVGGHVFVMPRVVENPWPL